MATSEPIPPQMGPLARWWNYLLAGRPLIAMAAALFTTSGHAMNLREMGAGRGWVTAEYYILQSSYLCSLALVMIVCPTLGQRWSCRGLAQTGLLLSVAGSALTGLMEWAPEWICVTGRIVAGAGCGMAIYFAPRLLGRRWQFPATWAAIILPVAGPEVISTATMAREASDWQGAFLFEGLVAAAALAVLLSMADAPETPPRPPRCSPAFLPALIVAIAALLYILHWGQLQGWLESSDIVAAFALGGIALAVSLRQVWPHLDFIALRENWIRLLLFFFGGTCQFVLSYVINSYGGTLVNLSPWQRALLVVPLPVGVAAALALSQVRWPRRLILGLPGAIAGLLFLSAGLYLSYQCTMDWPYWNALVVFDLNWFPAPSYGDLAPGRFLMGLGVGLLMISMDSLFSPDPEREEKVRPFLMVLQFLGGGIAAGVFINFLLIGHAINYSYSVDRDYIQADELALRQSVLRDELFRSGDANPDRAAEVVLYRFVNYEADNLVFATVYVAFLAAAMALAVVCLAVWLWRRWRGVRVVSS